MRRSKKAFEKEFDGLDKVFNDEQKRYLDLIERHKNERKQRLDKIREPVERVCEAFAQSTGFTFLPAHSSDYVLLCSPGKYKGHKTTIKVSFALGYNFIRVNYDRSESDEDYYSSGTEIRISRRFFSEKKLARTLKRCLLSI